MTRGSRERVDLQVIPLNTICGRVCLDRDRNAYCDEDEGIPNAVVAVNGSVTATSATGKTGTCAVFERTIFGRSLERRVLEWPPIHR